MQRAPYLAVLCAVAMLALGAANSPAQRLRAGDRLVYDLTLEVQAHSVPAAKPTTQPKDQTKTKSTAAPVEVTREDAGAGSETITILSVDPSGAATARVDLEYHGTFAGRARFIRRTVPAAIGGDGVVRVDAKLEPPLGPLLGFANAGARQYAGRRISLGDAWRTTETSGGQMLLVARRVVATREYQGLPTYVVQVAGTGRAAAGNGSPSAASISVLGTEYYDQRDALYVGGAARSVTIFEPNGPNGGHVTLSLMVNVELREFARAAGTAAAPALPSPSPTPPPVPPPSPTPTSPPTLQPIVGPTPQVQPTVTPRTG